jgi:hypothetical protein
MLAPHSQAIQTCPSSPPAIQLTTSAVLLEEGVKAGEQFGHVATRSKIYVHGRELRMELADRLRGPL